VHTITQILASVRYNLTNLSEFWVFIECSLSNPRSADN
jgi:hypothetical protein